MDLVINNGWVVDPSQSLCSKLSLGIGHGEIAAISSKPMDGKKIIDAENHVVCPGFIDAHMHEGLFDDENDCFDTGIFECMIRMGVTTALGGNCGSGPEQPEAYLNAAQRLGLPLNFALFAPHEVLRKKAGAADKYRPASSSQIKEMRRLAEACLDAGCIGISFGVRYIPGINREELTALCQAAADRGKIVSAHIRDDAAGVIKAAEELIEASRSTGAAIQVSHIGSMGAYGQMKALLALLNDARAGGLDIGADCYPYNAFSTGIGETTYDEGFLERYGIDYDSIEIAEGAYKGQRCTKALFEMLRSESPELITIGHVMQEREVDMAITHPEVLIGSDGFLHNNQGHPRASGTFPRIISEYVKKKKLLTLYQAIDKMTFLTAARFGLKKGSLRIGWDADMTIFDYEEIRDASSFEAPAKPPRGIKYVLIGGEIAVKDNCILQSHLGKVIRK